MDRETFQNILASNQRKMLDESFNQKVERAASVYSKGKSGNFDNNSDITLLEQKAFGSNYSQPTQIIPQASSKYNNNSKLPKELIESFQKTPPMSDKNFPSDINPNTMSTFMNNNNYGDNFLQPQTFTNPQQYTNYQPIPSIGNNVDYAIIKAIVNECISANLAQIKQEIINESSTLKGFKFGNGNKVQFLDSKGNLYEGVLSLKKKK